MHFELAPASLRRHAGLVGGSAGAPSDELEDDEAPASPDAKGLQRLIEAEVLRWFKTRKQARGPTAYPGAGFGEALDPIKLERLGQYEVHLARTLDAC